MSTMPGGTLPTPVSGTSGSSKKRGSPRTSTVVPPGTRVLLPASTAGDPAPRRRSAGAPRKSGSAWVLPEPANGEPPCTSHQVIEADDEPSKKSSGTASPQKTEFVIVLLLLSRKAAA